MGTVGFIVLAHENLDRAKMLVAHLRDNDAPVAIHLDARLPKADIQNFQEEFNTDKRVHFLKPITTEWGKFGLVKASLNGADLLTTEYTALSHVMLLSGSCLPLRPISQLQKFVERHKRTDFIESVDMKSRTWVQDGLSEERFDLYFPFSWKKNRILFDLLTDLQRRFGVKRTRPNGLKPYMGSQWWCLTRKTLRKILNDSDRKRMDRYFKLSWIPDESYFQSLTRIHSERLEARSLTWAKFDPEGRPFTVYHDHLPALEKTDHFFVRKAWARDDKLYDSLLSPTRKNLPLSDVDLAKADAPFAESFEQAKPEENGRFNAGRFTSFKHASRNHSAVPYVVAFGPQFLFEDLDQWIEANSKGHVHTDLFDRRKMRIRKEDNWDKGNLPVNKLVRNNAPKDFLQNFIWNQKSNRQVLFFDCEDSRKCFEPILRDQKATLFFVKNSWIISFMNLAKSGEDVQSKAAHLQRAEEVFAKQFSRFKCKCDVKLFDIADVFDSPHGLLSDMLNTITPQSHNLISQPKMIDRGMVEKTIKRLRNDGFAIDVDLTQPNRKASEGADKRQPPNIVST